uniref:GspE/PulE family protein n=1 Tax=Pontibacterium sp. TaxID=2036026 RepID=UPI0035657611
PLQSEALQYLALHGITYLCYYTNEVRYRKLLANRRRALHQILSDDSDPEKTLALAEEAPTVNLVNSLISRSLRAGASDLHIEPYQDGYRARIRVDGIMSDLDVLPPQLQLAAISRIKILSGMDISERRRPQDGKIEQEVDGAPLDIRVSALPLGEGESMVMRFLSNDSVSHDLEHIGLSTDVQDNLIHDLQRTSGVILMTGPTGSGKTTTLYALLNRLNTQQRKIITLEDPIEYSIEGLNQMQVHPEIGFDFAAGLRSVVRQDPDIIMVGEIRDAETARIALQSAITGHLVFSTVHTNDAPGAFTRLLELGVEEHLINSGLVAIVAQRLLRKLCPGCKSPVEGLPELLVEPIQQRAEQGINSTLFEAKGCNQCNHSGYKGRIPITEYMPWDDDIMRIKKDSQFTSNAANHLRNRGFRSLYEDGIERVLNGETTLSEVIRVAG